MSTLGANSNTKSGTRTRDRLVVLHPRSRRGIIFDKLFVGQTSFDSIHQTSDVCAFAGTSDLNVAGLPRTIDTGVFFGAILNARLLITVRLDRPVNLIAKQRLELCDLLLFLENKKPLKVRSALRSLLELPNDELEVTCVIPFRRERNP